MNGKRSKALRKVALQTAVEGAVLSDEKGSIPKLCYTVQKHRHSARYENPVSLRLGPCIRKIEKETKREYRNLTRGG